MSTSTSLPRDSRRRRALGFTLIELLAGVTVGGFVVGGAMTVYVSAALIAKQSRQRAALAQDAIFASTLLTQEIRMAGLGVPAGMDVTLNTAATIPYSSTLVAAVDQFGFAGDLPRPDAQYSSIGSIADVPGGNNGIMYTNESNGNCAPKTDNSGCKVGMYSVMFPSSTDNSCNTTSSLTDRTCPWGLKRLRGGDPFLVVDGSNRWFNAANNATLTLQQTSVGAGNGQVDAGSPVLHLMLNIGTTLFPTAIWPNRQVSHAPAAGNRTGYVSTPDRVFYRYIAPSGSSPNTVPGRLERIQCWGTWDHQAARWPVDTAVAIPTGGNNPCGTGVGQLGMAAFEPILGDLISFSFKYYTAGGVEVVPPVNTAALKRSIARVEFTFTQQKKVDLAARKDKIQHTSVGGALMRMRRL